MTCTLSNFSLYTDFQCKVLIFKKKGFLQGCSLYLVKQNHAKSRCIPSHKIPWKTHPAPLIKGLNSLNLLFILIKKIRNFQTESKTKITLMSTFLTAQDKTCTEHHRFQQPQNHRSNRLIFAEDNVFLRKQKKVGCYLSNTRTSESLKNDATNSLLLLISYGNSRDYIFRLNWHNKTSSS